MKNILVTGGAGFIGSHTAVELFNAGYTPVIVDGLSNPEEKVLNGISEIIGKEPKFYKGKYQDHKLLKKISGDQVIDSVIHFAAFKSVGESVQKPLKY